MATDTTTSPRRHQLDGLRAVACLLVVAARCVTVPIAELLARHRFPAAAVLVDQIAASGVDLFFTLSGVVLLRPFLRDGRPFHLGRYLWRRVIRICLPYLACLAATAPLLVAELSWPNWFSREILPPFRWADAVAQVPILWPAPVTWNFAWWSLRIEQRGPAGGLRLAGRAVPGLAGSRGGGGLPDAGRGARFSRSHCGDAGDGQPLRDLLLHGRPPCQD